MLINKWDILSLSKFNLDLDARGESILNRYIEDLDSLLVTESDFSKQVTVATINNMFIWHTPEFVVDAISFKLKELYWFIQLHSKKKVIEEEPLVAPVVEEVIEPVVSIPETVETPIQEEVQSEAPLVTAEASIPVETADTVESISTPIEEAPKTSTVFEELSVDNKKFNIEYLESLEWEPLRDLWRTYNFVWKESKNSIKEYLLTIENDETKEEILPKENA